MIYDSDLQRAVRKKFLPDPNPQKVELSPDSSLKTVFNKATQLFFSEMDPLPESLSLADSSGILIPVEDKEKWSLGDFYSNNSLQLSRYKLYVTVTGVSQQVYNNTCK